MTLNLNSVFESPIAKILDFLIDEYEKNPHIDHSKREVQNGTKLSEKTMLSHFDKLFDLKLIDKTRDIGKTEMFMLTDQALVSHLIETKKQLRLMDKGNNDSE